MRTRCCWEIVFNLRQEEGRWMLSCAGLTSGQASSPSSAGRNTDMDHNKHKLLASSASLHRKASGRALLPPPNSLSLLTGPGHFPASIRARSQTSRVSKAPLRIPHQAGCWVNWESRKESIVHTPRLPMHVSMCSFFVSSMKKLIEYLMTVLLYKPH